MSDRLRAYAYLHLCVFLWGFTAILGKLISLSALPLVWWRVVLCCSVLWWFLPKAQLREISPRTLRQMLGIGGLVGLHWLGFYGAIKLSNASVAVASMALGSFFSSLLEPLVLRRGVRWYEVTLGIFVIPGTVLIVGHLDWNSRLGFFVGLAAAFLAALFSVLNKQLIDAKAPPAWPMSFVELLGGLLVCSIALPVVAFRGDEVLLWPQPWDWLWMLLLAWGCTLLPYYLTLTAMRHLTAFTATLIVNLEPVYGVILASIFFNEHREMSSGFYLGMSIILASVFSHPFLVRKFGEKK
ncbi:MAG: DMT family transporter [Saprospiraceae bacterium]|nr:DMT family transporter [Saprospiraceae bacterium]MDW8483700.1 DMT family transporter [Saprospiraceae bacterium]